MTAPPLSLLGLAAWSRLALAQPAQPEVGNDPEKAFRDGVALVKQKRYADAIAVLEAALHAAPDDANLAIELAIAHDKAWELGDHREADLVRAVELYRAFLALIPERPTNPVDVQRQAIAGKRLGVLEPRSREIEARAEPPPPPPPPRTLLVVSTGVDGADIAVDGTPVTDNPAVVETTEGTHRVSVSAPGYKPVERDVAAVAGLTRSVDVTLDELPSRLVVRGDPGARVAVDGAFVGATGGAFTLPSGRHHVTVVERGHYAWAHDLELQRGAPLEVDARPPITTQRELSRYVLAGAGALVVAGGVTAIVAFVAQHDALAYEHQLAGGGMLTAAQSADYNADLDRRDTFRTASYVLVGAGLAASAAGLLMVLVDTPRIEPGAPPPLAPAVGAGQLGVSWQGRF